jgi:hypothetical protein
LIQANDQARLTLDHLATERAGRAAEVAGLRMELAKSVAQSHEFELQLVRARALLEKSGGHVE